MLKIGIICASDDELEPFLSHIEQPEITEKAMLKFYSGNIQNVPVVALYSGVCKVNAAITAQILIDTYQVTAIINGGVAGGMEESLAIFDTVVGTQTAYHDVADDILTDFHPWMPSIYFPADTALLKTAKKALQSEAHVFFGKMVTGEQFIADENRAKINEKYQPLSTDMETAAIAHVCYVNRIPFLSVRTITDTASHSGIENFEENCRQASVISKNIVLKILSEFPCYSA